MNKTRKQMHTRQYGSELHNYAARWMVSQDA
jgi:hypothetical protein